MHSGLIIDRARGTAWQTPDGQVLPELRDWDLTILTDRPSGIPQNVEADVRIVSVPTLERDVIADTAHRIEGLSAISTTSELFLEAVASVREEIGVAGANIQYTRTMRDKWCMKQVALHAGIPCARGSLASDRVGSIEIAQQAEKLVVKPRDLSGSREVNEVSGVRALNNWIDTCTRADRYLVEEFVDADLMHIDAVVDGDEVVWQLSKYGRPTHLAGGALPLSSWTVDNPVDISAAKMLLSKVIEAWAVERDVLHLEYFDTVDGPVFCEVAARPGGAGANNVFVQTRGVDLRHAKTLIDFGLQLPPRRRSASPAAGWCVFYGQGGKFRRVNEGGANGHSERLLRALPGSSTTRGEFSGVGVVTYVFEGDTSTQVADTIRRYEDSVFIEED